jgi:hypothetical protein
MKAVDIFFNEPFEDDPLLVIRKEKLEKVAAPKVVSYCPLCRRKFCEGDTLCNCKPATTQKTAIGGKTLVQCPPRVVGLTNRHMMRAASSSTRSFQRKFGPAIKRNIMQAATPVISGPFKTATSVKRTPDALPANLKVVAPEVS